MWRETNQKERDLIAYRRRIGECAALACELCARARATVWWRVAEFAVEIPDPYGSTIYLSGERLSTCYRCRDLIDKGEWDRVRLRRLAPLARHQEELWAGLRHRIVGQPATMRL